RYLGIEPRLASDELLAVLRVLISRNGVGDGVGRIYQTRDSLLVQARAQQFAARELTVVVSNVVVDPQLSKFKTANRLPYILAQQHAQRHGADEALLLGSQGQAVELTTCNIFAVFDDELWTPPLSDGALPGVTRAAVLELAWSLRLKVREESFRPSRLEEANEAFATNSLMEIAPIRNWTKTNRVTRRLQKAFRELVESEIEASR
ncbi:MAG: aminotransferase class IV, partial [Verrucomicrobiae bacterium]|nr:aminotransferase class IV [Verrucomicrobiae bacterium]